MRYVVVQYVTGSQHPYMPNQLLYRYIDMKTGQYSYGAWTRAEIAESIVKRKNLETIKYVNN